MVGQVAHLGEHNAAALVCYMHKLVTNGPRNLDIAWAMSGYGYDAVKWAEGQGVLAELVSDDRQAESSLESAASWYHEAASAARHALSDQPQLLAQLGVNWVGIYGP